MSRKQAVLSLDDLRKSAIKSTVHRGRKALSQGLQQRLASLGIFADGKRVPREQIPDQWTAQRERPSIEAALTRWERQGFDAAGSVERFVREASYTWLNRLAAIRSLEVRGLIRPIASLDTSGSRSSIVGSLSEVSPVLSQAREVSEALLWQSVFDELSIRLGALFDPHDPHGMLCPGSTAVLETLQAFEELDVETWRADDTLGWLYQFFTTKDERAKLRKKKGAAFTSDDLGPINQFYTPAWVVQFLVDNTLGALWRRMYPQTKIDEFCRLLLPATADDTPRPLKRVRDIKLIDPACGAMHFGVYAFDVLQRMYAEEGVEQPRDVPRLIVEENLVGIDIDRRAIQIAALNLYLKAARALGELGEDPPRDLRLNLGCADAAPPSQEQVNKLRSGIDDPTLRQAFDVALSSLKDLHAVGSLLDVEADVRAALTQRAKRLPQGFSPLPGLLAQVGWVHDAEPTHLDALASRARQLAEAALRADDIAGALAAEDALLAAKVLSLVGQRYDVVVMNPPYGELMPPATKRYLHRRYPKSKSDIYGAFFELAFRLAKGGGVVGALTSKTFLYLDTFKHVRKLFLETGRMSALIDAGDRVLFESDVDVGAIVGWAEIPGAESSAIVIRLVREVEREKSLRRVIDYLRSDPNIEDGVLYRPELSDLRKLPTETIAYWAPSSLLDAYDQYPALEPKYGEVRQGLATGDDERFLRYWWEVPEESIGQGKRWVPFAKGGDYSPYYESLLRVIDWSAELALAKSGNHLPSRKYYFREGITFPNIADRFHARALPKGTIFGHMGPSIFGAHSAALLGYLNSRVAQALLMMQSVTRHFEVGQVRRLCVPHLDGELGARLAEIARTAVARASRFATGDELDIRFESTWANESGGQTIVEAAGGAVKSRRAFIASQAQSTDEATELLNCEMHLSPADWVQITSVLGHDLRRDERARIGRSEDSLQRPSEHACRVVSSFVRSYVLHESIADLESVLSHVQLQLGRRFPNGDIDRDFADLVGMIIREWIAHEFHRYHAQLLRYRPRILRLSGVNDRVVLFVDALRVTIADLRRAVTEIIPPYKKQAEAMMAAAHAKTQLLQFEIVEDADFLNRHLQSIAESFEDNSDDIRPRVKAFLPLASYLTLGRERHVNARQ